MFRSDHFALLDRSLCVLISELHSPVSSFRYLTAQDSLLTTTFGLTHEHATRLTSLTAEIARAAVGHAPLVIFSFYEMTVLESKTLTYSVAH